MFKLVTVFFAIFLNFGSLAHSEPKFSDFLAERIFISGAAAPLRWDEDIFSRDWMFRYNAFHNDGVVTDIIAESEWQKRTADTNRRFAGHFVILETGCGTGLQCGVIVDMISGKVASSLPLAEAGYEYNPVSKLFIVNPYEEGLDMVQHRVTEFWVWDGRTFVHLKDYDIPWSESEAEEARIHRLDSEPSRKLVMQDYRPVPIPAARPTSEELAKQELIRKLLR